MSHQGDSFEIIPKIIKPWFKKEYTIYCVSRRSKYKYWRCDSYTTIFRDEIVYQTELLDDAIKMRLKYRTEGIV